MYTNQHRVRSTNQSYNTIQCIQYLQGSLGLGGGARRRASLVSVQTSMLLPVVSSAVSGRTVVVSGGTVMVPGGTVIVTFMLAVMVAGGAVMVAVARQGSGVRAKIQ